MSTLVYASRSVRHRQDGRILLAAEENGTNRNDDGTFRSGFDTLVERADHATRDYGDSEEETEMNLV